MTGWPRRWYNTIMSTFFFARQQLDLMVQHSGIQKLQFDGKAIAKIRSNRTIINKPYVNEVFSRGQNLPYH